MLIAYIHTTKSSHAQHLRVKQTPPFREDLKTKLQRIGSPARWLPDEWAWDTPLQPMSVVRLSEIARECGEQVEWRDGLREYAEQHLKQADYEHEVRLAVEKVIRDNTPLDGYVTLTEFHGKHVPPLRHQQILYQWSQRCRGILLAWEMGCIAEDMPILTKRGWVKIQKVRLEDEVWDGLEWVRHEGVHFSGNKRVTPLGAWFGPICATPDHQVLCGGGEWKTVRDLQGDENTFDEALNLGAASIREAGRTFSQTGGDRKPMDPEDAANPRRVVLPSDLRKKVPTYDIVSCGPRQRFQCGFFIVHNSGKTRAAADAAGGWYRTAQIPPMMPAVIDGKPAVSGGVLVVAPRTMTMTWTEELARWQNASSIIIKGTAQRKTRLAGMPAHFHVVNYESLKYTIHNRYAGIILDEVHRCSNNTHQTHHAMTIAERTTKRLGLTGTPVSNDLKSVFYPMLLIDGGRALGPSRTAFLERFFSASKNMAGFVQYDAKDGAGTEVAQAMATSCYFVKKHEVLDLPPKTHTPVYLPMTEEQEKYYRQMKSEALVYIQDATVTLEQASARMQKLLQVCQGFSLTDAIEDGEKAGRHFTDAKTEELIDLLTDQLRGRKVVVWCQYKYEIRRLNAMLTARGIPAIHIDGDVKSQAVRDAQKDQWNSDPNLLVYIRQLSMCEGVTLLGPKENPCSTTIYIGLDYRMTNLLQSQDRIHRIGQHWPCTYLYLLTENGVDRKVYNRLLEKIEDAEAVQATGKAFYRSLLTD